MESGLLEVYNAVREAKGRLGAGLRPGEVRRIGALYRTLKKGVSIRAISLDSRQENLHNSFQRVGKGEIAMQIVSYLRVSTKRQGESGLGLSAQREAVQVFASRTGASLLKEFVEVESGKRSDRPELAAALAYARRAGATLVVAKIDRLARNVAFLSSLMEGKVDFLAVDNPHANRLTVHVLAAVAEYEGAAISSRVKAALAQAKAKGVKLGSARHDHWRGREDARLAGGEKGRRRASAAIAAKAREEYADLFEVVRRLRAEGLSYAALAAALNGEGHRTRTGKSFTAAGARRVLLYAGGE